MRSPSKNRHSVGALIGALLLSLFASRAAAEPPHLETPADGADCPTASDLRGAIVQQLGRDDFERAEAPTVNVRVRRSSDGSLAADVSVTTSMTSTRTIDNADSCADLIRAAALSVALAIEKDAESKPAPAPTVTRETSQSPIEPPLRRDRVVLHGAGLTSVGLLPHPAAGFGLAGRVRLTESIWLSARGFLLPEASMPNDSFALRLFAAGPGACAEPFASGNVAAVGCAHFLAGAFDVTKTSVDMKSKAAEAYFAASLSAGARVRVYGPLSFEAAADAQVPLGPPTYVTTTCPPTGFEPPFAALALWLGAGVSIR